MTDLSLNLVQKAKTNISDLKVTMQYFATFFTFYRYNIADIANVYYLCVPLYRGRALDQVQKQ